MVKSQFLYTYHGNKIREYKQLKKVINLNGVKNIIETFCGTSALSFSLWMDYGNQFKYYLNDKDPYLNQVYKFIKTTDYTAEDVFDAINKYKKNIKDEVALNKLNDDVNKNFDVIKYITIKKLSLMGRTTGTLTYDKRGNIPAYQKKSRPNDLHQLFFDFIRSPYVYISNKDWKEVFNKFKNDTSSLFLFDPPYLESDNSLYNNKDLDVYEYFTKNDIRSFNSKIYFIVEDIKLIRDIFPKDMIIRRYNKTYEVSKKKTKHIIIYNH